MKKNGLLVMGLVLIGILFWVVGCSSENTPSEEKSILDSTNKVIIDEEIKKQTKGSEVMENELAQLILIMNGVEVKATLYDTVAAKEFMKLLPYSVTVTRAPDDLCGSVSEELLSDPDEARNDWKLGEIAWFGGWFTILVDHEEKFSNMPGIQIIGKINEEYMDIVTAFSGRVDITVKLADGQKEAKEQVPHTIEEIPDTNEENDNIILNDIEINNHQDNIEETKGNVEEMKDNMINIKVGDSLLTASLVENSTTEALIEMLLEGPVTIDMRDYGNMEKVGAFDTSLPRNDEQITTEAGDLILYQGSAFVIYYESNSWNFTRIGKINNITKEELKEVLGKGDVKVTLSLN